MFLFCLLTYHTLFFIPRSSASSGGCVAMSGGPALGHWEVKDCRSFKALSVCEQSVGSYHDPQLQEHHIDAHAPCPPGWESQSGLLDCFKVFSLVLCFDLREHSEHATKKQHFLRYFVTFYFMNPTPLRVSPPGLPWWEGPYETHLGGGRLFLPGPRRPAGQFLPLWGASVCQAAPQPHVRRVGTKLLHLVDGRTLHFVLKKKKIQLVMEEAPDIKSLNKDTVFLM